LKWTLKGAEGASGRPFCRRVTRSCRSVLTRGFSFPSPLLRNLSVIGEREDVARLTFKCLAELLQRIEVNSQRLALLQTPQRRMTDACRFGQPVECPAALF